MRIATLVSLCFVFVLGLCIAPVQAADKPADLIVGKWEPKDAKQKGTVEFTKDGKVAIKIEGPDGKTIDINGTYKFKAGSEDSIEVELTFMGETMKETLKIVVTKDELTTTDSKDKKESFKKAK